MKKEKRSVKPTYDDDREKGEGPISPPTRRGKDKFFSLEVESD